MKIIYNKEIGTIEMILENWQSKDVCFIHYSQEFRDCLGEIITESVPDNLEEYIVKDGRIIELTNEELDDIEMYGQILTQEERLLNQIKPSYEEVQKAENTIEILSLLQEVI